MASESASWALANNYFESKSLSNSVCFFLICPSSLTGSSRLSLSAISPSWDQSPLPLASLESGRQIVVTSLEYPSLARRLKESSVKAQCFPYFQPKPRNSSHIPDFRTFLDFSIILIVIAKSQRMFLLTYF